MMDLFDFEAMARQLVLHEGSKLSAYLDTEGYWTIGHGFNLSARGSIELARIIGRPLPAQVAAVRITAQEAANALSYDIGRLVGYLRLHYPWFGEMDPVRQRVAVDMAYNLGHKAEHFVKVIAAIERKDWATASAELYNSRWAHQVDDGPFGHFGRADRLVRMLLTGKDYTS